MVAIPSSISAIELKVKRFKYIVDIYMHVSQIKKSYAIDGILTLVRWKTTYSQGYGKVSYTLKALFIP